VPDQRMIRMVPMLRDNELVALVVGLPALLIASASACFVAGERGPRYDVVLGGPDPATTSAIVWIIGTVSGAIAVTCGVYVWRGRHRTKNADRLLTPP